MPAIRIYRDCTEFFNPGDAFQSREKLLDPGDKEMRNPSIVGAFRRIGLSDQGGTGIGAIFESWRRLGYLPPEIHNDKADKTFRLRLPKQKLQSEAQLLALASLGANLTPPQAAVVAFLLLRGEADVADIKALTGLSGPQARGLAQALEAETGGDEQGEREGDLGDDERAGDVVLAGASGRAAAFLERLV